MKKKKVYIYIFYFPVVGNKRKNSKKTKYNEKTKKKVGADLSWATAQLYCKKKGNLYCNTCIVLQP